MLTADKRLSCILCNEKKFLKFNNNFNYINSNITIQKNKCILKLCKACGTLQKNIDTKYLRNLSTLYKNYNIYQKFNTNDQAKFNDKGKIRLRSFLIFNKLISKINFKKNFNVLDYGSGNGNMLKPFLSNKFNFNIYACDIKNRLSNDIKFNKKFTKFMRIKELNKVNIKFDLIILSHSLEHLIDPINDLKLLLSKLSETGKIIVQIPDYQNNPYDLIVYDHTIHFDINSINFLSYNCNSKIDRIYNDIISDEFTIFFSKNKKHNKKNLKKKKLEIIVEKKINLLKKNILILKKLKSFSILGSSISALWVASMFKNKIINIYDEDVSRIGTKFNGKIIKSLSFYKGEKIILPFSKTKLNFIKKRLIKTNYDYLGLQI